MKLPIKYHCLILFGLFSAIHGGNTKCTNPKGRDGDSNTEGCIKKTCKGGTWRPSLDPTVCCYGGDAYQPGERVASARKGCAEAFLECSDDGKAVLTFQAKNRCEKYSTSKQVSELKEMLENYMENTACDPSSPTLETETSKAVEPAHSTEGPLPLPAASISSLALSCPRENIRSLGNDIITLINVDTWMGCACACRDYDGCIFWTWTWIGDCFLKDGEGEEIREEAGFYSGSDHCCT